MCIYIGGIYVHFFFTCLVWCLNPLENILESNFRDAPSHPLPLASRKDEGVNMKLRLHVTNHTVSICGLVCFIFSIVCVDVGNERFLQADQRIGSSL